MAKNNQKVPEYAVVIFLEDKIKSYSKIKKPENNFSGSFYYYFKILKFVSQA